MYQTLHNLILAFHGCSRDTYEKVLYDHKELNSSTNDYDWLGNVHRDALFLAATL